MKLIPSLSHIAVAGVVLSGFSESVAGTANSPALQNILMNTDRSDAYDYPTDLTRGILPV